MRARNEKVATRMK
ncbi:unnamed protein product [Cuscuta epithymum]|uniref:Uncharacterized protein n=1 Tax=Cuscuta epithymum TaxID=186058 RepID=A0AAV0DEA4_9ASTE|nr:unnamed protein product [Cuscuta epithymum]